MDEKIFWMAEPHQSNNPPIQKSSLEFMSKIPLSKCFVNPEVEEAALRAIRSGQYILGKECTAFEAELAAHTGTAQCVLGSSWTMIVYCLHQLQGIGPGDEIIVPSHRARNTRANPQSAGATSAR